MLIAHGFGICCDVEPELEMEKVLFAADELTGLVWSAALMRPSKSCQDMELSSLKKKFKDKRFAAGVSRDIVRDGAEKLGWELDELLSKTLEAMKACEADIAAKMEKNNKLKKRRNHGHKKASRNLSKGGSALNEK